MRQATAEQGEGADYTRLAAMVEGKTGVKLQGGPMVVEEQRPGLKLKDLLAKGIELVVCDMAGRVGDAALLSIAFTEQLYA